jgi:hypothetical protein
MPENRREYTLRVFARKCKCVGVTYAGGDVAHQDFTLAGAFHIDLFDDQWLACFPGNCGS